MMWREVLWERSTVYQTGTSIEGAVACRGVRDV